MRDTTSIARLTSSKTAPPVPEPTAPPVEDVALAEHFEAAEIETGDAVSMRDWIDAAMGWAMDGWDVDLPPLTGSQGLAQAAMLVVVAGLAFASVRWLLRQRPQGRSQAPANDQRLVLPSPQDLRGALQAALAAGDVDGALGACWRMVEHELEMAGVLRQRAGRSAYELVHAVQSTGAHAGATPELRRLAHTYVRLRYGPHAASIKDARALAEAVDAFVGELAHEDAA